MFRFRLQRLLELREHHEQARARELASARNTAEHAALIRETLEQVRRDSLSQLHEATGQALRVGHLNQLGTAISSIAERIDVADGAVRKADEGVRQAQELLDEAARDRRVLDRLKTRHADAWRAEEAYRDRNRMDEVALMQFARKTSAQSHQETHSESSSAEKAAP